MKQSPIFRAALSVAVALAGIGVAQAEPVERSGNVYHKAVCARGIGQGEVRCFAHVQTDAAGNEKPGRPAAAAPNVTPSGFGPTQLRSAYQVTVDGSAANGGFGNTIAIVDAYGYANAEADLAVYRSMYGLPACTTANSCFTKIDQNGGTAYPRYNSGWAQEQALDLDMASAICPKCKILLVQSSSATLANLAKAVDTAGARGALVISNSYGGGESGSSAYAGSYSKAGVAITVSTGDSGYGAAFPATAPGVIAVGGTKLVADATSPRGWKETAWTSGGSGCSTVYGKPAWQGATGCANRMEADISAVADPATGVAVYGPTGKGTQSGWLVFGGTSASAPIVGAIYGAYGVVANAAQHIWAAPAGTFNDVTAGSNGTCTTASFCNAGPGYDGPTGMGTPVGPNGL